MTSMVNGLLQHAPTFGFGSLAAISTTKPPAVDRWEEMHGWSSKSKGKNKNGVALSALTLLAFLFFLNILQNCLQDHMDDMKGKGKGGGMHHGYRPYPYNMSYYPYFRSASRRDIKGDDEGSDIPMEYQINAENRAGVGTDKRVGGKTKTRAGAKKQQKKRRKNPNKVAQQRKETGNSLQKIGTIKND